MIHPILQGELWILNTNVKMNLGSGEPIPEYKADYTQEQVEWSVTVN
jgi:hypothetical protein